MAIKKSKHRVELAIPKKDLTIITIDGYVFLANGNQFQCATCFQIMGTLAKDKMILSKVTGVKLHKTCDCPPQE